MSVELPAAWKPLVKPAVSDAPLVTDEQLDLIRRTVAKDATADELKLYLYDCARQGVHPLDRLIHYTKRGGKYTPVTSIDFMRTRAADTGEYAGSDDAVFPEGQNPPSHASVSVYRLVQGHVCKFTATARWSEYKPERDDFMWKRMPHTMLAKCAEALALRKGFPRQLAGLYAKEEMDQADSRNGGFVVEAPVASAVAPAVPRDLPSSVPYEGDTGALPDGAVYITKVEGGAGSVKGFLWHSGQPAGADSIAVFKDQLVTLAAEVCQTREPVRVTVRVSASSGKPYVNGITRVVRTDEDEDAAERGLPESSF